ncbi:hypothetical protein GCM10027429_01360 [Marivirga atlantica]|jgi:hypothetical protein|uniref:Signal transduction histidine kinase dimerisation/phosphoacceptor domain-containing protein n=1 Tax=Marivirga atlantica TaxID=1548457 RepID=A0A937ACL3_9BACT|nr:hypothetical protein [Marivirga atlantica]MBL0763748.1 hypothetical protein [Marivirga atlantica]
MSENQGEDSKNSLRNSGDKDDSIFSKGDKGLSHEQARSVKHDIRNSLANVELAIYHLRSEVPTNKSTEDLFEILERGCKQIESIITERL